MGLNTYISSPYIIHQHEWDRILSSENLFNNENPLNIEIGPGKGKTLMNLGRHFPEKNFVGLEKTPRCLKVFRDKTQKNPPENIRILHCFYETIIKEYILDNSIDNFFVYFPDPWPKKKHRKRRFLQESGFKILEKKLKEHGRIYIKTDFLDYWLEMITSSAKMHGLFIESFGLIKHWISPYNVTTSYEQKYSRMGKKLYYLVLQKYQNI